MGNKKNKKDIEKMQVKHESLNKEEKKKCLILTGISIILSIIAEFIFVNSGNEISIARLVTVFGICAYIGLHFVIGFKKLYTIIVENRFKISAIMVVLSTIIGYFQNNVTLENWLLDTSTVLSLWWNLKFYGLLLVTYELFKIITDGSQGMSIIGTITIVFSGAVQWNFEKIDSLIWGQLIVILINKLLNQENSKSKAWFIITTIISAVAYAFTFTGYAISFGYIFIALIIWILIKNKEKLKDNSTVIILTTILSIACIVFLRNIIQFNYNDVIESNIKGISYLFTYLYNTVLPFKDLTTNSLYGSFISIFPLPMLFALYYMYKNDDHAEFLLPITIVAIIETVFCMSGLPDIINKVSLFENVSLSRCVAAVNLSNVYILFYTLKHIDKKIFSVTAAIRIAVVIMVVVGFISYPTSIATRMYLNLFMIEICLLSFLYSIFHDKNYKNVLLFFLCLMTLISGVTVNSIIVL